MVRSMVDLLDFVTNVNTFLVFVVWFACHRGVYPSDGSITVRGLGMCLAADSKTQKFLEL